jgi:surface polysaccharide O-acyltransferase-like enzyme
MSGPLDRRVEIDALKAAGILTIVLIHAMRTHWDPAVSTLEVWIGHATRFGVPAFLCASGYLYARTSPVPLATTLGRLRRILVPYLIASLLAQAFRAFRGEEPLSGAIWSDLLIGASFGPFYYVFVIAILVVATPAFAHLSRRAIAGATLVCLAVQWFFDAAPMGMWMPLTWHIRAPMLWWPYFLLGWCVRLYAASLAELCARHRIPLAACLAASVLVLTAASSLAGSAPQTFVRTAAWLDVYAILALIAVVAHGLGSSPPWLRFLSDATYAIYLFHLFFLLPVQDLLPLPNKRALLLPIALPWLAGLAGSLALVVAARAAFGRGSRNWVGA